jgi:hypothetical protein
VVSPPRLRARRAVAGLVAMGAGALLLSGVGVGPAGTSRALGQSSAPEVTPQTDAAVPAHEVVMLGASPEEAPAETWGIGKSGAQSRATAAIVRYSSDTGWTLAPPMLDGSGKPLVGFVPAESDLAGSITPQGSGALLGAVPGAEGSAEDRQVLLVRARGAAFSETSSEPPLENGQRLFAPSHSRAPMLAALDEAGGSAGALVVPVSTESSAEESTVLHWSDATHAWTIEHIEVPKQSHEEGGFRVLAIAASSPGNAWLLAQLSGKSETVALFQRQQSGGAEVWQPVSVSGEAAGAPLRVPLEKGESTPYTVTGIGEPPSSHSQLLTVSAAAGGANVQGVWIDGERADTQQRVTMFFKPEGADNGALLASWCGAHSGSGCSHVMSSALPTQNSRSFAWAGAPPFGERVITGLSEGVSLRLEGEEFTRVLALGASATYDVGGSHGAAFSSSREGWLGSIRLPVHLTTSPEANLLQSYPTPFRRPLLALAPQPGAEVGSLSSEAVAVGENGEVARYQPGAGWQPETLLNIAGVRQTPHLRAVAWPTPSRVYTVGTNGQMWLWRGETDLWEKDPATPVNFRGDLLGIAFNPNNTSAGYAVGQGGVLLRYGKTWTQEPTCEAGVPQPCIPPELASASFTSIAFAGSEAIVAYRVPHFTFTAQTSTFSYTGGVMVNDGTGWKTDAGAAAALASEAQDIPWAVAGLPDGGAAISAQSAAGVPRVLERNAPGAAWEPTAQPYPGFREPGALGLFREGGALRVIGSGAAPDTARADEQTPPPAGFPPALIRPYPLAQPPAYLFRQTASGWSEQEHDHDEAGPPPGSYKIYDKGYEPDPSWAVLISPGGNAGWAVGGFPRRETVAGFETADIARYAFPTAESAPPAGVKAAEIPAEPGGALFAIGGGSQCAAPCAARANARVGPDAWLSTALKRAGSIAGLRDFLYTGPRLTTGATLVKATVEIPYAEELARYAQLLGNGTQLANKAEVYAAGSPTDHVEATECQFEAAFGKYFPRMFEIANGLCGSGEPVDYYAVPDGGGPGGPVRVLVLDDSDIVGGAQLGWLRDQLQAAQAAREPAIVVGNANLNAQEEHHESNAASVVQTMVAGHASAYFFNAHEQNLKLVLHGSEIPAYGSGTLGYVNVQSSEQPEFIGASGFLLARVGPYEPSKGRALVTAELIPGIGEGEHGEGELALEAQQGTLLRRSQVAVFAGLARRPRAGNEGVGSSESESLSYVFTPIPANCVGAICASGLLPEYSFTSSNEEVGRFVQPELHSSEANAVKFNSNEEPVFAEGKRSPQGLIESKSGLFCALNKGETTVTITAGGVAASLKVNVQEGSVRRPCGTVPVKHPLAPEPQIQAPAPPPPAPSPAPAPAAAPPVLPAPPPPPAATPLPPRAPARTPPPQAFFIQPSLPVLLTPFLPPPLVQPANPTPPSGTSAVTSPVEAAQKEEEQEQATESVSNQAVAYRQSEHEPTPVYLLGIILLAAFAGASAFRGPRRGRREVRVAPATISATRSQRRHRSWREPD